MTAQPDEANKLSWSTAGSVEKNTPHLVKAHAPLLSDSHCKKVLEIASGFLDHSKAYAREHPEVTFSPTECNDYLVSKLEEARASSSLSNIAKARKLDVLLESDWDSLRTASEAPFDLVTCTNLLNVAPWTVTEALFVQIGQREQPVLDLGHGKLALYCCLKVGGEFQSEADKKFDATLKARNPEFGIRNLDDVVALAEAQGLKLVGSEALGGGTNLFIVFAFSSDGSVG